MSDATPLEAVIVAVPESAGSALYGMVDVLNATGNEVGHTDIVILPELWVGPDEHLRGRFPRLTEWIRARYDAGAHIYSACSTLEPISQAEFERCAAAWIDAMPPASSTPYRVLIRMPLSAVGSLRRVSR